MTDKDIIHAAVLVLLGTRGIPMQWRNVMKRLSVHKDRHDDMKRLAMELNLVEFVSSGPNDNWARLTSDGYNTAKQILSERLYRVKA